MANRVTAPELERFVVVDVKLTGVSLGAGAYGSVEEVEIPGARVAAKKLHTQLINLGSPQQVAYRYMVLRGALGICGNMLLEACLLLIKGFAAVSNLIATLQCTAWAYRTCLYWEQHFSASLVARLSVFFIIITLFRYCNKKKKGLTSV